MSWDLKLIHALWIVRRTMIDMIKPIELVRPGLVVGLFLTVAVAATAASLSGHAPGLWVW